MNAVEHIVECYFRYCRGCLTIADVKIKSGNNRQADLLAYNLLTKEQFHVESSVTHCEGWQYSIKELCELFDRKFRGVPAKREGEKTDAAKGKNYFENIIKTYRDLGFSETNIQRIFVVWAFPDKLELDRLLLDYNEKHSMKISILSFRDEIIPKLKEKISTSNYDDEVLRTFSLLQQHDVQR